MTDKNSKTGKGDAGDKTVVTSKFNVKVESVEDAERIDALVRELLERELGKGGDAPGDGGDPEPEKKAGELTREHVDAKLARMRTGFVRCMAGADSDLGDGFPEGAAAEVYSAIEYGHEALVAIAQAPYRVDDMLAAHLIQAVSMAHAARYGLELGRHEKVRELCVHACAAVLDGFVGEGF